jgi:hypothetical protein
LQALGKSAGQLVFGDTDRLGDPTKGIFRQHGFLILAEDETDSRAVVRVPQAVIDHVAIEVHLAGVFRLESPLLQFDHHEAAQAEVIK